LLYTMVICSRDAGRRCSPKSLTTVVFVSCKTRLMLV